VLNQTEPPRPENGFIEDDNADALSRFRDLPVLGRITYYGGPEPGGDEFWENFAADAPGLRTILEVVKR
jgi:hypothetical protein